MAVDACELQPYPADPEALWDSVVQRLFTLPDETLLFAGHEIPLHAVSTVWGQRQSHTWFKKLDRDAFITHWTDFSNLNN